jgi:hypothetical protein
MNATKAPLRILVITAIFATEVHGQTFVSGDISGTWSPSGNPYIITDNTDVPSGQTLTIQPGTVIWIGSGFAISLNNKSSIQAIGDPTQRITFEAPINSQYWNQIYIPDSDGKSPGIPSVTNRFDYCDFQNATNVIFLAGQGGWNALEVLNCTFSNCVSSAINWAGNSVGTDALIRNNVFSGTSNGCVLNIPSSSSYLKSAVISANLFDNLSGAALSLQDNGGSGAISIKIINNAIVNCGGGVNVSDPWDAQIQSCIFDGCIRAVKVSGSLSRLVNYNDFYGNGTNFIGYPSDYGTPIILNRNGTSCDLLYNIFQNPDFASVTNFQLLSNSPCIDAGEGSPANFDNSFPPSLGTVTNDIGAYGGPNAGQWIVPISTNIFTLSAAKYIGVTINPPSAGHYELDYSSDLGTWTQITNMNLSMPFLYTEPASSSHRFYRAVKLY